MWIVSGTKRSGTSMWMQALTAAGIPVLGRQFPKTWGNGSLRAANPEGFYEGLYRDGIFFATNPNPQTGEYLRPEDGEGMAVKVFVPGVVRSELAHVQGVIANVREWRQYTASVQRLWNLDDAQREEDGREEPVPLRVPAALEWFTENYGLLRDHMTRKYPILLQTYDSVLHSPAKHIDRALQMLGAGELEAAVAAVKPERRTQSSADCDAIEPTVARVFDDFYEAIAEGNSVPPSLWEDMTRVRERILPQWSAFKIERAKRLIADGAPPPPAMMIAASMH